MCVCVCVCVCVKNNSVQHLCSSSSRRCRMDRGSGRKKKTNSLLTEPDSWSSCSSRCHSDGGMRLFKITLHVVALRFRAKGSRANQQGTDPGLTLVLHSQRLPGRHPPSFSPSANTWRQIKETASVTGGRGERCLTGAASSPPLL